MISPARKLSYQLLSQIESRHAFSDDALNSDDIERLDVRDRHLTTEIVYGTLRWQALLDYLLAGKSSVPWQQVEPEAKILLRMSLYQMWQMDRIPDHALVYDAVELAKRKLGRGIDRFINGILRHLGRTRPWTNDEIINAAPAWVRASLPEWLWERWSARYGETTASEFASSLNRLPQPAFRITERNAEQLPVGTARSDLVPGAGIRVAAQDDRNRDLRYQDEASQMIPYVLGSISGCRIWDSCAAPGGKAAILAALCGERGIVVASDLHIERVSRMAGLLNRQRPKPELLVADAAKPAPFGGCFDAVIADVPCSGLGTLRRNPEIKWRFVPNDFASLQQTQKRILESVSGAVRGGGRLLYSTCSTEPEENENVIESFLRSRPDFSLESPSSPPGVEKWTGKDKMVRTFPSARLWDGFFAALLRRHS